MMMKKSHVNSTNINTGIGNSTKKPVITVTTMITIMPTLSMGAPSPKP